MARNKKQKETQDERALRVVRRDHRGKGPVANWGDDAGASSSSLSSRGRGGPTYRGGKFRIQASKKREERAEEEEREEGEYTDEDDDMEISFTMDKSADELAQAPPRRVDSPAKGQLQLQERNGLLLPGHVEITAVAPPAEASSSSSSKPDDGASVAAYGPGGNNDGAIGDFVELDGDRSGAAARYWEVERRAERLAREECEQCGEKGHDKRGCPHTQCLACGVLDEHATRECPMGRSCFRCGARGHQLKDCPKPRPQAFARGGRRECQRCGATSHSEATCATLWRVYAYNYPEEWQAERKQKARELVARRPVNSDGDDDDDDDTRTSQRSPSPSWDPAVRWCYNCATKGNHWGDDCPLPRCHPYRGHMEPTAYSEFVSLSGPFATNYGPPPATAVVRGQGNGDDDDYEGGRRYRDFAVGPSASMHVCSEAQIQAIKSVDALLEQRAAGRKSGRGKEPPPLSSSASKSKGPGARSRLPNGNVDEEDDEEDDWFSRKQQQQQSSSSSLGKSKSQNQSQGAADQLPSSVATRGPLKGMPKKKVKADERYKAEVHRASQAQSRAIDYPAGDGFWAEKKEDLEALPAGIERDHGLTKEDRKAIYNAVGKERGLEIYSREMQRSTQAAVARVKHKWGVDSIAPTDVLAKESKKGKKRKRKDEKQAQKRASEAGGKKKMKKTAKEDKVAKASEADAKKARGARGKGGAGAGAGPETAAAAGGGPGARYFGSYADGSD
ncbi:hypothetical protein FA10DRAFT_149969 [Acaromyces ingoldii]|uniref:CCHC-type domain-containing protein n=1 Tax=Acaromyces ingoldii TaxID=215250 RepID=A0A316YNJ6_9BASI|nr:hypothetical protein FA10DRAFT_149969 [Acaromyces ingoldii]PWN89623.1 hypothetical protein FA10DRAFT_149969 [Acaromyces ingoldii]